MSSPIETDLLISALVRAAAIEAKNEARETANRKQITTKQQQTSHLTVIEILKNAYKRESNNSIINNYSEAEENLKARNTSTKMEFAKQILAKAKLNTKQNKCCSIHYSKLKSTKVQKQDKLTVRKLHSLDIKSKTIKLAVRKQHSINIYPKSTNLTSIGSWSSIADLTDLDSCDISSQRTYVISDGGEELQESIDSFSDRLELCSLKNALQNSVSEGEVSSGELITTESSISMDFENIKDNC